MRVDRMVIAGFAGAFALMGLGVAAGWLDPAGLARAVGGPLTGLEAPDLADPALLRRGAGHYEQNCAGCHASPARPGQAAHLRLIPPPPTLHLRIEGFLPEMLFTTVRDGVANTAMPAWPAPEREDEIWAMVAFLTALPQMDAATYRGLAGLDPPAGDVPPVALACARCHGPDGADTGAGAFPRLDLQSPAYLADALAAFRDGRRSSGFMQAAAAGLTDAEIAALAAHFGRNHRAAPPPASAPPQLVLHGAAERRVPACGACHGLAGPVRPEFPSLAGQDRAYLETQLRLFADGEAHRGGGPYAQLMREAARALTKADIAALAAWYAGLAAPPPLR